MLEVSVRRLDPEVPLPAYAHPGDAGCDLVTTEDVELAPGERAMVPTGIALALPEGYAAFVHPRSGLAAHHGVSLVNAPGTIDAGYRGEVKVLLLNTDLSDHFEAAAGERIAQLVIAAVAAPEVTEVDELSDSARAQGGFGSTGR